MELLIILLRYILLYIIITSGSIFISIKTNKKIERCIAPNMLITILLLYIFGMFEGLKYGVWFVSIINIILGIYAIIKGLKDKEKLKENIFSPGFAFFTIVFFILMITTYTKNLVDYDHYFYRSYNTKVMYYTDTMSRGYRELYQPGINLLEYFFMKVIGTYIQGTEAFAVQLLGFSLLIPLFDRKRNNKFVNTIVSICIICIPAILGNLIFYEAAYPDALLGLIIGYSIYTLLIEKDNKFKMISVILALSVATITKPIGFYISGIVIGMYLLAELLNNKCNKKENIKKFLKSKELKNIIILTVIVILVLTSWKIFTKINNKYNEGIKGENSSRVNGKPVEYLLKSIATTTFGYYEENHDSSDSNNDLIRKIYALTATIAPVKMSIYTVIALIMILAIIVYKNVIKVENKNKYANAIIALTVGLAIYIILIQVSYILKFSTEEMLDHSGLNRYMPTFLLGMIYFILAVVLKNMEEKDDRKINYIILIAIIIACTPLQSIANVTITSGIYNINSIEYCNNGRIPADKINNKIEEDSKLISISQNKDKNIFNWMIKYYLYPDHKVDVYNKISEENIEKVKERILRENISYMYITSNDEELNKVINKSFNTKITLKDNSLYQLEMQENQINLKEIPLD